MSENTETTQPAVAPAPATDAAPAKSKVLCFVSKQQLNEAECVELIYAGGQKVWVGKQYIKYKQ